MGKNKTNWGGYTIREKAGIPTSPHGRNPAQVADVIGTTFSGIIVLALIAVVGFGVASCTKSMLDAELELQKSRRLQR